MDTQQIRTLLANDVYPVLGALDDAATSARIAREQGRGSAKLGGLVIKEHEARQAVVRSLEMLARSTAVEWRQEAIASLANGVHSGLMNGMDVRRSLQAILYR